VPPVRSTRVRLPGRIAREDVDAGDARRARTRDGPSQSHPLRQINNPAFAGFFICLIDMIEIMQGFAISDWLFCANVRCRNDS
jgi:hypothetical protein